MDGDVGRSSGAVTRQRVTLTGDDRNISHAVFAQDVTVVRSELDSSIASSNKVKCTPVVNYDWEAKKYNGQLVATDQDHQYIAYSVKGRSGGIVRLLHRELADRVLLRGHTGTIVDLQFSYSHKTILASIDEHCHLFVNIIDLTNVNSDQSRISTTDALEIRFEGNANEEKHISWCHAVSNDDEDDDDDPLGTSLDHSMSLAVTSGNNVYVLHITSLIEEHGSGPHSLDDIKHSIIHFSEHTRSITSVTFSPEGSALSTSSEDGTVLFYSIELRRPADITNNKRLFKWSPHDGLPVTMVKFLDNFDKLDEDESRFWGFCVTGTNENTELKLWNCENWTCLQTVRFVNSGQDDTMTLNAQIDNGGKFLILSDINSTVLYILSLHQDSLINTAHVSGISELLLGAPALSFSIISVKKKSEQQDSSDESSDEDGDTTPDTKIVFQLQVIQPRAMQDVNITFTPIVSPSTEFGSLAVASSVNSHHVQDHISEVSSAFSTEQTQSDRKNLSEEYIKVSPLPLETDKRSEHHSSDDEKTGSVNDTSSTSHVLLTPDAFTSNKNSSNLATPTDVGQSPKSGISSLTHVTQDSLLTHNSLIPNNVNTFLQASSISTVSSTISPKSSLVDESLEQFTADRSADRSSMEAENSTPRGLTREHDSTPTNTGEHNVMSEQATISNDETARQLEQIFPMPTSANQSLELPSHLTVLTEDDLLNQIDQAATHPVNQTSAIEEDRSGWPVPPEVRESAQRQSTAPLAEHTGDLTDESDTESDEDNVSSSDMGKQSDAEELNVKEIEKDAGVQLDMQSPGGGNIPVDEPVMPQFVQTRILSQLDHLSSEMATLKQMLDTQAREIHALKNSDHTQAEKQTSSKQTQMYFTSLTNKIDELSHSNSREHREQINNSLADMKNYIAHEIKKTVENTVASELNRSIVPCLSNLVNPVKQELHRVMAEKLTVADATFKDSVNRLVNNKQMVEYIGRYVANALQPIVTSTFHTNLQQVVPGFDAATRNLFNQLNQTFTAGLNRYMKQVEEQGLILNSKQMSTQELVSTSCETAVNSLAQTNADLRQHVSDTVRTEVGKNVKQSVNSMKAQVIKELKDAIKTELNSVLTNQEEILNKQFEELRTIAATPEPRVAGVQAQIDAQLQVNNFETALSISLSASDLDVVLYCIRKIDTTVLFSDELSIQSPTLLSLIQQLGVVIDEPELELKVNFLFEAVLKLDPTDEVISQHMQPVLKQVQDRLEEFLRSNSSSSCKHQIRAVMFSIKNLLRNQRR